MSLLHRLDPLNVAVRAEKVMFRSARALGLARALFPAHSDFIRFRDGHSGISRSQIGQDLFVLWTLGMKRGGYFVEFGAGDGAILSNTLLLEERFEWSGILAEPLPDFHASLRMTRRAALEPSCVWGRSGEMLQFVNRGYLSTIAAYRDLDRHAAHRHGSPMSDVETISLVDLLRKHGAPATIDFLSIDTEGSEFEILSAFPFNAEFEILSIACEHNFTETRELVAELLERQGYRKVGVEISGHDDWFVRRDSVSEALWDSRAS